MGLSLVRDVTAEFNANNGYVADMSNWDYTIWQFITTAGGTINITVTNDSGAVTGSFDGNSLTATNFVTGSATRISDINTVTTIASGTSGMYRVDQFGRYVKFAGSGVTATKVIIHYYKIS